ncbi:MAG: tyrosine--tRNA ligase [Holosporales bacterium]|jgi:tyrosyl-tRNA synthetase|nr:tyrosine--tRNA ligase [Holosporales bacterium]
MDKFRSELLSVLQERDFIYQCTDIEQLDNICATQKISGYIGFDATAKSLQVGNLSVIMLLRWFQHFGHKPIVLVGGGTSRLGDPSFKQTARPLMSLERIQENINGISKVFAKLLKFDHSPKGACLVNNADWLSDIKYLDFLRDFGCHFTVNKMLSMDCVKTRLDGGDPLSFIEFNYSLMQAYDFFHLNKEFGCVLQMGGADQWCNIISGVDLTRKLSRTPVFGLTAPLVTNASGMKMGKTAAGAVWLNEDMCLPYDYWQFWRNTDDRDVICYLKKFTELPMDEIHKLSLLEGREINDAKTVLADEATALIHGRQVLDGIHAAAGAVFGADGDDATLPSFKLNRDQLPIALDDLFVLSGLCASKGDLKRLVTGSGVSVEGQVVTDPKQLVTIDKIADKGLLLSVGKKRHIKVVVNEQK